MEKRKGQTLAEYVTVICLVTLLSFPILSHLGQQIARSLGFMDTALTQSNNLIMQQSYYKGNSFTYPINGVCYDKNTQLIYSVYYSRYICKY